MQSKKCPPTDTTQNIRPAVANSRDCVPQITKQYDGPHDSSNPDHCRSRMSFCRIHFYASLAVAARTAVCEDSTEGIQRRDVMQIIAKFWLDYGKGNRKVN